MSKKKFVLRLSEDTYKAIEKWANDDFRSVNGQIEYLLTTSLRKARRLRNGRKKTTGPSNNENTPDE